MMIYFSFTLLLTIGCTTGLVLNKTDIGSTVENAQCTCNHEIKQLYTRIEALESNRLVSGDAVNMDARAIYPDVIGFTVCLEHPLSDLPVGSNVLFSEIRYNAGSAYDPQTGVFTCPRSGMYLFFINVLPKSATTAEIVLKVNGINEIFAVSERATEHHDTTGGNALARHLVRGDRVWVETFGVNNQDLGIVLTSFTGVLVQSTNT